MDSVFTIEAKWHEDMWVATSEGIPGLAVEARNLNELCNLLNVIVPELLEENSHLVEQKDSPVILNAHLGDSSSFVNG
ncbi:MAG: DUF1902 domain-containing protein [Candidatus Dadabacteria bacterium]|nr:DUF1902 domain-containing protein [Candidatus Dadabacteria bacterium]MDE0662964.1 DUF1902 domain-containing protein [Candidatus Dadabacteria bacterium]